MTITNSGKADRQTLPSPVILIIDDDTDFCRDLILLLGDEFNSDSVESAEEAREVLIARNVDAILLDIDLGEGMNGFQFLDQLRINYPEIPVIMISKDRSVATVSEAMLRGADGYVGKRPVRDELVVNIHRVMEHRRTQLRIHSLQGSAEEVDELVGESHFMRRLRSEIDRLSGVVSPVLITGESGTGKEIVARAIHRRGARREEPFLAVNCTAFPETLLESELFGHEQGAFTGAHRRRIGRFQEAGRGTLFLDEIGDLSMSSQVKLLRVLAERNYRPLGGQREQHFSARLITATNIDLHKAVQEGRFRRDLFYRINVLQLSLLPLRERVEDIEPLAQHIIHKKSREMKRRSPALDSEALRLLQTRAWPGNVRELANVIENALCHCEGNLLCSEHFQQMTARNFEGLSYEKAKHRAMEDFQRQYIASVLRTTGGNVKSAAELMDLPRQSLHRLMRSLGMTRRYFIRKHGG